MKTMERWVLRISDSDATWFGLGWLRPAKNRHLGPLYILFSSILLGLPGVGVGIGLLYLVFGSVKPEVCFWIFVLATLMELFLHVIFAHYWNRRAATLAANDSVA